MATIKDFIELFSEYTVGDEEDNDITTTQLSLLESSTLSQANNINSGRFAGDDFLRLHTYIILDKWSRKHGKGTILQENVKEASYRADIKTTSSYMDDLLQMVADYDDATVYAADGVGEGASRADIYMEKLSDDGYLTNYGQD